MTQAMPRPRCRLQVESLEDRVVPSGDMVIQWNNIARDAVRIAGTPAPVVSRIFAITQAAVYDSVNALDRTHEVLMVDALANPKASREAAVAAAAHQALSALLPTQAGMLDTKFTESLATIPDGKAEDDGVALGMSVANQILALRQNDGSAVTLPPYVGNTGVGQWRPTPPGFLPGLTPQWGDVTPFVISSLEQFKPGPPPELTSAEYTAAFNEVKELGALNSATRTADQTAIARFWLDAAGTATPIGHLNLIAQAAAEQEGNTLEQNARLFAGLNIAMANAVISCWDTKYEYNFWRPQTAIREADLDGNPDTIADPTWAPLFTTPPHPSYSSGHTSNSGAAAAVLAAFFGSDNFSFTLASQHPNFPATRSYTSFSQAAEEAALSRMYGGIHWSFDNNTGLEVGNEIGQYVMANLLRPVAREAVAGVVNGELIVVGTDGDDTLRVTQSGGSLVAWSGDHQLGTFSAAVSRIVVDARDGDDLIHLAPQVDTAADVYGGRGDDHIFGGRGDDRIFGEDGDDVLQGNQGNDLLDGGAGDDHLLGGVGDDTLYGGLGDDWLIGGPGVNVLDGGPGRNHLVP